MPRPGKVTFLSQSGALCTAILDWSIEREIGFAACVSAGNMTNVGMADLLDYFAEDEQTEVILLYLEGIDNALDSYLLQNAVPSVNPSSFANRVDLPSLQWQQRLTRVQSRAPTPSARLHSIIQV